MRLIDADEFERRIKRYDTTDYADKALYNFAHNEIITMPTVCDIDAIKAEINKQAWAIAISDTDRANGMWDAVRIIDKYRGDANDNN